MSDAGIVWFTLRMAAMSTILIAPLALILAGLSWRAGPRVRMLLDVVGILPLVLPPTAVGFLLLQLLSKRHAPGALLNQLGAGILFTPAAVVLACAVMSFPLMFTSFRVAIESSDRRLFDIARTLGATPLSAFWRVTLPLGWRGLLSGVVLAFCRAVGEFGATILIAGNIPGRTQTLALAIYQRAESGRDDDAALLVVYVLLIATASIIVSESLVRAQQRRLR